MEKPRDCGGLCRQWLGLLGPEAQGWYERQLKADLRCMQYGAALVEWGIHSILRAWKAGRSSTDLSPLLTRVGARDEVCNVRGCQSGFHNDALYFEHELLLSFTNFPRQVHFRWGRLRSLTAWRDTVREPRTHETKRQDAEPCLVEADYLGGR